MFLFASLSGFLATILGAFGTHVLQGQLSLKQLNIYQTAVQYHFFYTFALLAVAIILLHRSNSCLRAAAVAFSAGIILFSGSLYVLALTGISSLGIITPIGGSVFLMGWILLAMGTMKCFGDCPGRTPF